jgi:hypothetical protein
MARETPCGGRFVNPVDVVQNQLEAYNARDLDRFLKCFTEDIRVFRPPSSEPVILGKPDFAAFYVNHRFNRPLLKAEILNRMVLGNKVFDHERIFGIQDNPIEMVVVFEVENNMITTIYSFLPNL